MTVEVHDPRLPGGMLQVDTDDPTQAAAAAQKYLAANAPKAAPPPPPAANPYVDALRTVPGDLAQGVAGIAGLPGDISSGLTSLADWTRGKLGVGPTQKELAARQTNQQNLPIPAAPTTASLNTAFSAPTGGYYQPQTEAGKYAQKILSFAPAAIIGGPAGIAKRLVSAVAAGAGSEGAEEAAKGTGLSPGWQTAASVGGALAGGVAGHYIGAAGTGAIRSLNAFSIGKGGPALIDPEAIARQKMGAAVAGDGGTAKVGQAAAQWAQSGASGPTLLDVGGNGVARLIRAAAGGGTGDAQNLANDYASKVRANFQPQVMGQTRALVPGVSDSATTFADKLEQEQSDTAQANYQGSNGPYAQPATVTKEMVSALQGPEGRGAINRAYVAARANRNIQQMGELQDLKDVASEQGGGVDPLTGQKRSIAQALTGVSAGSLDRVRIAMRDIGGDLYRRGATDIARGYKGRVSDIDTALDQTPGLQPARASYRQMQAGRDALDVGKTALNTGSDDYAAQISQLAGRGGGPPNIGTPLGVGHRQALLDKISAQTGGNTGAVMNIAKSDQDTRNLAATFGADKGASYQQQIANEATRVSKANFISPNTGSQTQLRADDAGNLMNKGVPTSLYDLAIRVYDTVRGHGAPLTEAERSAIVRMGTTPANLANFVKRNPGLSRVAVAQIAAGNSNNK